MSEPTTQEMDGKSLSPTEEKLKALREVLPEVFTENQIDWEKLKATLGENINFSNERYVLNWAGKSDAFKILQVPSTKTLVPAKEESVNFDETQNIFIEGENLEVLKVLQKSYFGKIKMIYIDPPYNTGNDSFIYPDKFSKTKADYEKRVGDKDEDGYMMKDGMFKNIAEVSKDRIRRVLKLIEQAQNSENEMKKTQLQFEPPFESKLDLGFKSFTLLDSNFKQWKQLSGHSAQALAEQIKLFVDPVAESATEESMVYELLLKSGKDLNSQIERRPGSYWINGKELVLILDKVSEDTIKEVIDGKPSKVIALDRIFKENDQLKTNTVLQMRDAGVEFKTI